jgi:hypothetical protein
MAVIILEWWPFQMVGSLFNFGMAAIPNGCFTYFGFFLRQLVFGLEKNENTNK